MAKRKWKHVPASDYTVDDEHQLVGTDYTVQVSQYDEDDIFYTVVKATEDSYQEFAEYVTLRDAKKHAEHLASKDKGLGG